MLKEEPENKQATVLVVPGSPIPISLKYLNVRFYVVV